MNRSVNASKTSARSETRRTEPQPQADKKKQAADFRELVSKREQSVKLQDSQHHSAEHENIDGEPARAGSLQEDVKRRQNTMQSDTTADTGISGIAGMAAGGEMAAAAVSESPAKFATVNTIVETIWKEWQQTDRKIKSGKWSIQLYTGSTDVVRIEVELNHAGEWHVSVLAEQDEQQQDADFQTMTALSADQFADDFSSKLARLA